MAIFSGLVSTYFPDPLNDDGVTASVKDEEKLHREEGRKDVDDSGDCCRINAS